MKKLARMFFFTGLIVVSSGPGYAEWVAVGPSAEDETVYINPETIRRKGELVEVWVMWDRKLAKQVPNTTSYYSSIRDLQQYNCQEARYRFLATAWFSGNMGKGITLGDLTNTGAWRPIPPDSIGRHLMELVCKR
jgi:hypothetical protein